MAVATLHKAVAAVLSPAWLIGWSLSDVSRPSCARRVRGAKTTSSPGSRLPRPSPRPMCTSSGTWRTCFRSTKSLTTPLIR